MRDRIKKRNGEPQSRKSSFPYITPTKDQDPEYMQYFNPKREATQWEN